MGFWIAFICYRACFRVSECTLALLPITRPAQIDGATDEDEYVSDSGSFPAVAPPKSRRVPIPLDFGVFEALVGDKKTRRTVLRVSASCVISS